MLFECRYLAFRKLLHGIGAHFLRLIAGLVGGARTHGLLPISANACRSLCNPERMRVLTVPRGAFRRTATSAYVNSEKNAASMALRSSGVSTTIAERSA